MKVLIVAFLFVVLVVTEGQKCNTSEDCGENECCSKTGILFVKSGCRPLAKENKKCSRSDAHINGAYWSRCPCESGLVCKPEKVIKSDSDDWEIRINERCAKENEETTGAEVTQEEVTNAEEE